MIMSRDTIRYQPTQRGGQALPAKTWPATSGSMAVDGVFVHVWPISSHSYNQLPQPSSHGFLLDLAT